MRKNYALPLLTAFLLHSVVASADPGKRFSQKLFSNKPVPQSAQSVNNLLYKPGKSKNFMWFDFGIGSGNWMSMGGSLMTYTPAGLLATRIDTNSFGFFGSNILKETHFYDAQNREIEQLNQNFDSLTQSFVNNYRLRTTYDQQGMMQEMVSEQWLANQWVILGGYRDVRTFNAQNQVTGRLRSSYSSQDSVWINEARTIDYQYDGQNRLISYTDQQWDSVSFVNRERVLIQYGADNRPNQAILQDWNGAAFVDSSRITDLQWFVWNGNVETSMPLVFIEQKKSGAVWVNFEKQTNTFSDFGGQVVLTQKFIGNQWVNSTRYSNFFDAQANLVFQGQEEYIVSSWDTLQGSSFHQNIYDASGRILETVSRNMTSISLPDQQPILGWKNSSRKLFSQHQAFTSVQEDVITNFANLLLQPNPAGKNAFFHLGDGEGKLLLTDMQGREILKKEISANEGISTAGMKAGLYLVLLQSRNGKTSRGRLVVE